MDLKYLEHTVNFIHVLEIQLLHNLIKKNYYKDFKYNKLT